MFENWMLKEIFLPKEGDGELTVLWRKLHTKVLHDLCSSSNITRLINHVGRGG
jgi:hypothetical protein